MIRFRLTVAEIHMLARAMDRAADEAEAEGRFHAAEALRQRAASLRQGARGLVVPPKVRSVVIAVDHDHPNTKSQRPGPKATTMAAHRWPAEGRRVRLATPDREGSDLADLTREAPRD